MAMDDDVISSEDRTSIDQLGRQIKSLDSLSKSFGRSLSSAFAGAIVQGKSFEQVLRGLGQRLIEFGLKAAFKPLETAMSGMFDQFMKGSFGGLSGSSGAFDFSTLFGGGQPLNIKPFAKGGIIAAPSYFPLAGGLGLAGERGAEAIMPLTRGSDGRLGVAAAGGGASVVNVTIATPDVESFRRADVQVSAALARAVARGRRGL
jgi:phage-related minor tail protein